MSDKSTAELKADLRAEREYLESGLPAFRAQASRNRIREIEAELEARGVNVEPEPEARREAKRRKVYHAHHRVRLHAPGWEDDGNTLAMHEDRGDGTALCGQGLDDWTDPKTGIRHRVEWKRYGPGPVDCGKCANVSGEPTGYEPLAEPQGESVRTVSGGPFDTNRRRH